MADGYVRISGVTELSLMFMGSPDYSTLTVLTEPPVIPGTVPRAGILIAMEKRAVLVVTLPYTMNTITM